MFTLYTNVQITRRKTLHMIHDHCDQQVAAHKSIGAAIKWLHDNGEVKYLIDIEGEKWIAEIEPMPF